MPPVPTAPGAPRKRTLWTSAKADNCQNTFSFRSEGHDGVNMYDAYVGAVRGLEGPDDPMFDGYGTKVTYIVEIEGDEYREQKYAHEKTRTVTRAKAIKQVSQVVWAAMKQQHAQGRECFPDLLKPWYLLRLDRVKKSAFECVLECRLEGEVSPSSSHSPTLEAGPAFSMPSFAPSFPLPLHSDTIYVPPPNLTSIVVPEVRHSFGPAADRSYDQPAIPPTQTHDDVQALSNNSLSNSTYSYPQADVANNADGVQGSNTLSLTVPSTLHTNSSTPSGQAQSGLNGPLNAAELENFRRLFERFFGLPFGILQHMNQPSAYIGHPVGSYTPPHSNHPVAYGSTGHDSHHGPDLQISRAEEVQGGPPLGSATVHEPEMEPMPADDMPVDDDTSSDSDESEFDAFDEDDVWPKPGISPSPHRWNFDENDLCIRTSVSKFEENQYPAKTYDNFAARLFTLLREYVPHEHLTLAATKDLELQDYYALDLYYKPLEDQRGRRNIRRRLRWGEYAVAIRDSKHRAYYDVYRLFRVVLPSGRAADVAYVRWLRPSTCTSAATYDSHRVFDWEDACVFIPARSIIRPTEPDEVGCERCCTGPHYHYYVSRQSLACMIDL